MWRAIDIAVLTVFVAALAYAQQSGAPGSARGTPPTHGVRVVPSRPAQAGQAIFGPPASIFSPQPGKPFGPPPSVTSLGPTGYTFAPCVLGNCGHFRRFGNFGFQGFVASYPVVIPIFATPEVPVVPVPVDDSGNVVYQRPDENEIVGTQGGGSSIMYSGQRHVTTGRPDSSAVPDEDRPRRVRPRDDEEDGEPQERATAAPSVPEPPAAPAPPQETTVLVFKDGHKLSLTNYAIQGDTLFNFSGQGPRRVAITDLDLKATMKVNDENGVQFRLP